jgi:3-methyladenine DNA glycosylase/8-oxoguanine DNA glycosylase
MEVVTEMRARLAAAGLTDARAFDVWTALVSGIAGQQIANEPGGDRWVRLIDDMADALAAYLKNLQKERRK